MKLAIIGSRTLTQVSIEAYIPHNVSEIVSGAARGIDTLAKNYAEKNAIPLIEFRPQYDRYGRAAPLKRNEEIAAYADEALVFWDGKSKGTEYTIELFKKRQKKVTVILFPV